MKRSLALLLTGALCASCIGTYGTDSDYEPSNMQKHWSSSSVPGRVQRTLTSYDPTRDGTHEEWFESELSATKLTIQRHLFGYNPTNPLR